MSANMVWALLLKSTGYCAFDSTKTLNGSTIRVCYECRDMECNNLANCITFGIRCMRDMNG